MSGRRALVVSAQHFGQHMDTRRLKHAFPGHSGRARCGRSVIKVIFATFILCDALMLLGVLSMRLTWTPWSGIRDATSRISPNRLEAATDVPSYSEVESLFVVTAPSTYPGGDPRTWVSHSRSGRDTVDLTAGTP
jgi:hypothetical protein